MGPACGLKNERSFLVGSVVTGAGSLGELEGVAGGGGWRAACGGKTYG
jgi:hypothetical protein